MSTTPGKELITDVTGFGGMPVFVAMILLGFALDTTFGLRLIVGLITCYVITALIRMFWFRRRPDHSVVRKSPWYIHTLDRFAQSSFPSLHTMRATVWSCAFALFFQHPLLYVVAVLVIMLTGYSRLALKRHFLSDIIAGAAMGIIISVVLEALLRALV